MLVLVSPVFVFILNIKRVCFSSCGLKDNVELFYLLAIIA
uniref:Uncharacterized protein n=1 Tax=Arundo donax TaxID=35708 RepID=A0A0A9F945_ARUDO